MGEYTVYVIMIETVDPLRMRLKSYQKGTQKLCLGNSKINCLCNNN